MEIWGWIPAAVAGSVLVWLGSGLLDRASRRLSGHYRLPEAVQGAAVIAIGSSLPELFTVVISSLAHGDFELGMSAIIGSAVFNILAIPGLAGLTASEPLRLSRDLVYKEALFYLIAVAALLLTFSFAVVYHPVAAEDGDAIEGRLTRLVALLPVAVYALYAFTQYQDTIEHIPAAGTVAVRPAVEWARLAASLVLIIAGVEALIRAAIAFGDIFATPSFLWGITVVAIGTSLPDLLASVRAARSGRGIASLANVIGSNVFDLLICIPAGVLIAGAAVVNFSVAAPMMAVLTGATVVLFLLMRTSLTLTPRECLLLLCCYAGFVVWMAAECFGVIDTVVNLPP